MDHPDADYLTRLAGLPRDLIVILATELPRVAPGLANLPRITNRKLVVRLIEDAACEALCQRWRNEREGNPSLPHPMIQLHDLTGDDRLYKAWTGRGGSPYAPPPFMD